MRRLNVSLIMLLAALSGSAARVDAAPPTVLAPSITENAAPVMNRVNAGATVEVVGPRTGAPGVPLTCEIVVRNVGMVTLARVRVEQETPEGTKLVFGWPAPEVQGDRLSWSLSDLEPGAERRLKLELQPGSISELEISPTISYSPATGLKTSLRKQPLAITQTMPATVGRGGKVDLILQVANNGRETLKQVTLVDYFPAGLKHPRGQSVQEDLGILTPGQVREVRLPAQAALAGRWTNSAFVYADGGLSGQSRAVVQVSDPVFALRWIDTDQSMSDGGAIEMKLEAVNPGPTETTGSRVVVALPEGLDFASASEGGVYDADSRMVRWTPGAIRPGTSWAASVKLQPRLNGEWTCVARVDSDQLSEVRAQRTVTVRQAAALTVEVLNPKLTLESGAETDCELMVLNQGSVNSTNVRLVVRASGSLAILKVQGPTTATVESALVQFEPLAQVPARGRAVYRVRLRGLQPGQGKIRIELVSDQQAVTQQEFVTKVHRDPQEPSSFATGSR